MIITLLRVYSVVLGLVTLTLFHGNRFVRNINCKLHVLDSSPLQFKHCIFATNIKKIMHNMTCVVMVCIPGRKLTYFLPVRCLDLSKALTSG